MAKSGAAKEDELKQDMVAAMPVCDGEADGVEEADEDFEQQLAWALAHEKLHDYIKFVRMELGVDEDEWEFGSELLSDPEEDVANFQEWLAGKGFPTCDQARSASGSGKCRPRVTLTRARTTKTRPSVISTTSISKSSLSKLLFSRKTLNTNMSPVMEPSCGLRFAKDASKKFQSRWEPSKGIAGAFNKEDKAVLARRFGF